MLCDRIWLTTVKIWCFELIFRGFFLFHKRASDRSPGLPSSFIQIHDNFVGLYGRNLLAMKHTISTTLQEANRVPSMHSSSWLSFGPPELLVTTVEKQPSNQPKHQCLPSPIISWLKFQQTILGTRDVKSWPSRYSEGNGIHGCILPFAKGNILLLQAMATNSCYDLQYPIHQGLRILMFYMVSSNDEKKMTMTRKISLE